jgi:NAD(P)-dependent dehydrogenase (short-subunit alcohol dehydrogenase family)
MELSCKGMRVIVTAGASGIGHTIARTFLDGGAGVHICDINHELLTEVQAACPEMGMTRCDVSDPVQVDLLFNEAKARLGGLDILVNVAGISGPTARVEDIETEAWDRVMSVNINSQFYCARQAVPLLKEAGGGSIVNISSSAGLLGYPMRSPYAASKWALIGITKTLAMELGEFGIRVNAICPGSVESVLMNQIMEDLAKAEGVDPGKVRENFLRTASMRTFVTREDVANLVLFICSEAGNKISGQSLSVDGHTETLRT